MGNQSSSLGNEEAFVIQKGQNNIKFSQDICKNGKGKSFEDKNSSYVCVKTDNSSQSGGSNSRVKCQTDVATNSATEENIEFKDQKISTVFEWKEGGECVYLVGSFCNWNQKFLMNKINNKFELSLAISRGIYQYKFIVDGKWRFSKHHPTSNDRKGNVNNIIDTSYTPIPISNQKEELSTKERIQNGNDTIILTKKSSYNSDMPQKKELYIDATVCPDAYKDSNLFTNSMPAKLYTTENTSYLPVPSTSHVNIGHLNVSINNVKKGVVVSSSCQRIRNKFITYIYLKPVN